MLLVAALLYGLLPSALLLPSPTIPARSLPGGRSHALVCAASGDEPAAADPQELVVDGSAAEPPPKPVAVTCSFKGCENGRIAGGLWNTPAFKSLERAVGFEFPIKAYRPCPECAKKGIRYSRTGQTLDEVVFKKNPKGGYYGE